MKGQSRPSPRRRLSGWALCGILWIGLGIPAVHFGARAAQPVPSKGAQPAPMKQGDGFDWAGTWEMTLSFLGTSQELTLTITRSMDGSYTSAFSGEELQLGAQDDRRQSPGYPQRTDTMSSSAQGDTFVITTTTYYYGPTGIGLPPVSTHTGTSIMELRRTANPEELSGEYYGETTHFITGNEAGWYVVLQPKPFVVTGELTARRVGEGPAAVPVAPPNAATSPDFGIAMGCTPRISSEEDVACSVTITPNQVLAGTDFSVIWQVDGVLAGEDGGAITSDAISLPLPSPGSHQITVNVTSIASGTTKSASAVTEVIAAGEQPAAPPSGDEAPSQLGDSGETGIPGDWPMVSPLGQAAAAAATTLLLAIWLVLETQGAAAGSAGAQPVSSSSSDLVNNILQGTNHLTPQEAGDWLAASTSGLLDSLDRPPAAPAASQPPAPANPPQAGPAATPGGGPSSAYNGPVAGVQTEVFGDRDAYLIMQALQLVPTEWLPGDHLMEVDPFNLDPLLGGHSDGRPHRVVLGNGRELFVHSVQGVAFEDRRRDEATDLSTIDFTDGFAIAVDVVIPGPAAPTPGTPGSAGGQAGQAPGPGASPGSQGQAGQAPGSGGQPGSQGQPGPGQEGAQTPGGGTEGGTAGEGTPGGSTAAQGTGEPQAGTSEDSPTRTPEEDQAELDRFFGDEPGSGSQGQGSGGSTSGGSGSQGLDGDTGGEEVQLEEVDEGDLYGDEIGQDMETGEGVSEGEGERPYSKWDARVDNLIDDIKAGMLERREPPAPEGGEGLGGNQAGIVDGDDIDSATGTL